MALSFSVAWSPDGSQLATGSYDETAKVWNLAQLKVLSLNQALFLSLVYHDYHNNQPLTLDAQHKHLYTIYCTLPANIKIASETEFVIQRE
jgi:WD40 repeat protein